MNHGATTAALSLLLTAPLQIAHSSGQLPNPNAERIDETFGKRNLKFSSHPRHGGSIHPTLDCVKDFSLIPAAALVARFSLRQ